MSIEAGRWRVLDPGAYRFIARDDVMLARKPSPLANMWCFTRCGVLWALLSASAVVQLLD